jgi:hypothetical protein
MCEVSAANRRIHSRRSARFPARLSHGSDAVEGTVENIGEGGVFFATHNLEIDVDEGAPGRVSFHCKRGGQPQELVCAGTILRTERYFDGEAVVRAFAFKFDELLPLDDVTFE